MCWLSNCPGYDAESRFYGHGIAVGTGPGAKARATGPLWSVDVRDPDGNLIEISNQLDTVGEG